MFWDDLIKVLSGPTIYRLDSLLGQKLAPLLYVLGLTAIVLWAVGHLITSFALGLAPGLWSILEIVVYGALALVVLRIACEAVLVFFATREALVVGIDRGRHPGTLLDEVGDAIRELAEDDDIMPATDPAPYPPAGADDGQPAVVGAGRPRRRRPGRPAT